MIRRVSLLSGSFTFVWHISFDMFVCMDFLVLALCFFFLSFSWVLSFFEVWQSFIVFILHGRLWHI